MKNKKTNMTIAFNQDQMDLFDFALVHCGNGVYNRTTFLLEAVRDVVKGYLGLPYDLVLDDDELYQMALDENKRRVINIIGQEKYDEFIKKEGDGNIWNV